MFFSTRVDFIIHTIHVHNTRFTDIIIPMIDSDRFDVKEEDLWTRCVECSKKQVELRRNNSNNKYNKYTKWQDYMKLIKCCIRYTFVDSSFLVQNIGKSEVFEQSELLEISFHLNDKTYKLSDKFNCNRRTSNNSSGMKKKNTDCVWVKDCGYGANNMWYYTISNNNKTIEKSKNNNTIISAKMNPWFSAATTGVKTIELRIDQTAGFRQEKLYGIGIVTATLAKISLSFEQCTAKC